MRALRILAAAALAWAAVTAPATAQEDDRGRIVAFLESQLSDGAARQVRIEGFRGALSSTATLERLSIADAAGEWLVLEAAELSWTRSALLGRELRVETLRAGRLTLLRPPEAAPGRDLPPAEATPFALPQLPLRIEIGTLALDELVLGAPVLGQAARFTANGTARLADGAGSGRLTLDRLDGPRGEIALAAAYDNAARRLEVQALFAEDAGGLAATLMGLPGAPATRLTVAGAGPIDGFRAEIALSTGGVPRVAGAVTSTREDDGTRVIGLDLGGDLTPLLAPAYHGFFGDSAAVVADLRRGPDGAVELRDLALRARALSVAGGAVLDPAGRPRRLDLSVRLADPEGGGAPVRLPVAGIATLDRADLRLAFDAAAGPEYRLDGTIDGLTADALVLARGVLEVTGSITPDATGIAAVTARIDAALDGIGHADPGMAQALGPEAVLGARIDWHRGAPLRLADLDLRAGDATARGAIDVGGPGAGGTEDAGEIALALDLGVTAARLSRFAAVAGAGLGGMAEVTLQGTLAPLSGAFDLHLDGTARNLTLGAGLPDALTAGVTEVGLHAIRDTRGLRLERLRLDAAQLALSGSGRIGARDGTAQVSARLADLGLFTEAVRGPATMAAQLTRRDGLPWQLDAELDGPAGLRAGVSGGLGLPGGAVDLQAAGVAPLALANRFIAPRSVAGVLDFDLGLRGAPGLAALDGRLRASGARLSLPTLRLAVEEVGLDGTLAGGRLALRGDGRLSSGGTLGLDGQIDLGQPGLPGAVRLTGQDLRLVDPTLYDARVARADLNLSGALARSPAIAGIVTLGETELRVPEGGFGGAAPVPEIAHGGETAAQRATRAAAGLIARDAAPAGAGGAAALDLTVTAPGRIFLRGRGIDAEFGGEIRLTGRSDAVIPVGRFELVRGRIAILGTRLDITEGAATLEGNLDPFLRLRAVSRAGGYTITIAVDGPASAPEIGFSSAPALPEDEVLAQLLFGRSVSALSPVQLVQLADAAATLAGGTSRSMGLLSRVRDGLGLDDLDLQTDADGNAAVRAGRYLSDNVYSDVTVTADGAADLSLNIDLTPDITARGSFSSDGSSSVGVFFERDY